MFYGFWKLQARKTKQKEANTKTKQRIKTKRRNNKMEKKIFIVFHNLFVDSVGNCSNLQVKSGPSPTDLQFELGGERNQYTEPPSFQFIFSVTHPRAYFILGRGGNDRLLLLIGFGSNYCLLFGT